MKQAATKREQRQRKRIEIPKLAVSKRFGIYKKEEKKEIRKIEVPSSAELALLVDSFSAFTYQSREFNWKALDSLKGRHFSPKDIEMFSIALAQFQDSEWFSIRAGSFLSHIINSGNEVGTYTIHTRHLEESINFLGCWNKKIILVEGDVGDNLGYMQTGQITVHGNAGRLAGAEMQSGMLIIHGSVSESLGHKMKDGEITVHGNAGVCACSSLRGGSVFINGNSDYRAGFYMRNGLLTIKGNAGSALGNEMRGGKIIVLGDTNDNCGLKMGNGTIEVNGNCRKHVGKKMTGGELHIGGDFKNISLEMSHGKIHHKGKLIVDK